MKFLLVTCALIVLFFQTDISHCDSKLAKCPSPCTCANFIMDCRLNKYNDLGTAEGDIPSDIEALILSSNNFTELKQIPEVKTLHRLSFAFNQIKTIAFDTFDNLDELVNLDLSHNQITTIADDIFEWNPLKLQVLKLNDNKLEFVQHFLFYDLDKLTDLYLQNNAITFIHPHAFLQLSNLRRLRLDGNRLHTFNSKWIQKFQGMDLSELRFDNNPWSCDIDMKDSINWLNQEKQANWFKELISGYPLKCTRPNNFLATKVDAVDKDKLVGNKPLIKQISRSSTVYEGVDILLQCVVDTTDDHLPVATISWTAPNNDVYRLQNAYNFEGVEVHPSGALKITKLTIKEDNGTYTCTAKNSVGSHSAQTTLTIKPVQHGQPIPTFSSIENHDVDLAKDKQVTQPMSTCPIHCQCISDHVDCAGDGSKDKFDHIPTNIPEHALSINMALNKLTVINANEFTRYEKLEEIRLDNNEIATLNPKAFSGLGLLTTLTLRDNNLESIPEGIFKDLKNLNVLVLDNNRISIIRENMFQGLKSLSWLYIRNNKVAGIEPSAFLNLPDIKFIHLENNLLNTIEVKFIKDVRSNAAYKDKKVFVDDNNFFCDSRLEPTRKMIQSDKALVDFFGDGIMCSYPTIYSDRYLLNIHEELTGQVSERQPTQGIENTQGQESHLSGVLIGGIIMGILLTIFAAVAWKKWGKRAKTLGRSYNYSNIGTGEDQERRGLTEPAYSGNDTEAFV